MNWAGGPEAPGSASLLQAVLDSATQGVSVWDQQERLLVCNRAYLEMYRFSADEVCPGTSLEAVSELTVRIGNHPDFTAARLLEVFRERMAAARDAGGSVRSQKPIRGRVIATTHTHLPGIGWVVAHEDVTEQTEQKWHSELTEKSLDTQNRRFSAALDNMSHGLSIFDAETRLVICNKRYLEIFALSPDEVHTGTPLLRIAELRCAAHTAPADMPDFIDYVAHATQPLERFVETTRLQNGRSIQATRSPIEGGGFVAVHQDITEDIERLEALEASHAQVAVQKLRFEAALANISHGLSMYDAEGRLVIANQRYQQIYGLADKDCRPGAPYDDIAARRDSPSGLERIPKSNQFVEVVLGEVSSDNETVEAFRLRDGRIVSVRHSAMADGGFIRTHRDITTQVERFDSLKLAERTAAPRPARPR